MVTAPPRLRRDLTVSRQEAAGGFSLVVKDPASGRYYRFRDAAGYVAEHLDGETTLEAVRRGAEERFGGELPEATLRTFLKGLGDTGLLENVEPAVSKQRPQGRIRGSPLYLRLALFDPDASFTRLERRLRFLFTPQFVVFSAAVILAAVWVTITQWSGIAQMLPRVFTLSAIPLILAVCCVIVSFHEGAHGLTCKHFGGEVHETGFMLIYFQPAFYCNVSDAWLFPERSKRLWVGFAGPWFELFIWALATLLWLASDVESTVSRIAYIFMTVSGVKTLFNFNPFIKLDGYYLLSDALDIPNLRRRSFRYIGGLIKRGLGLGRPAVVAARRRERLIYLGYGVVATVMSMLALGYAGSKVGRYLIDNHQPAALAAAIGLLGMKSRRRFRKLFGGKPAPGDPDDDGDCFVAGDPADGLPAAPVAADGVATETAETPPEPVLPAPTPPRARRRPKKLGRWLKRLVWLGLAAGLGVWVAFGQGQLKISGSFTILPEQNADVRSEVDGIIAEVRMNEGDTVRAGQVVARLSDEATQTELSKTEAAIRESQANLKMLEAGPIADSVALARAGVAKAQDRIRYTRERLARLTELARQRLAPQDEYETARQDAALARRELDQAQGQLRVVTHGTRPEELEATRARIDGLETQRQFLQEQLTRLEIHSPITGIVATPSRQLESLKGTQVTKGALIAKIYDFSTVEAQLTVPEREIADVRAGQEVVLRTRAYPNELFHGTVVSIGTSAAGTTSQPAETPPPTAATSRGVPGGTFMVTTRIQNRSLLLRPGMTGQAKILGRQASVAALIERRLARTFKVEIWSWW
jgi:multidrug resistance efflux pump